MKLLVDKQLENKGYQVSIQLIELTEQEKELLKDFGTPVINVGGAYSLSIKDAETDLVEIKEQFKVGDLFRPLPVESPLIKMFSQAQHGVEAEVIANAFTETMVLRITKEITDLKGKQDLFTGSTEIVL